MLGMVYINIIIFQRKVILQPTVIYIHGMDVVANVHVYTLLVVIPVNSIHNLHNYNYCPGMPTTTRVHLLMISTPLEAGTAQPSSSMREMLLCVVLTLTKTGTELCVDYI